MFQLSNQTNKNIEHKSVQGFERRKSQTQAYVSSANHLQTCNHESQSQLFIL